MIGLNGISDLFINQPYLYSLVYLNGLEALGFIVTILSAY